MSKRPIKAKEDPYKHYPDNIRALIKKGKEQGFVTYQEIMREIPDGEENLDLLDQVMNIFLEIGVEAIDATDEIIYHHKESQKEKKDKSKELRR